GGAVSETLANSAWRALPSPMLLTAAWKAFSSPLPELVRLAISSRKWFSSSSRISGGLIPRAAISWRHSSIAFSISNILFLSPQSLEHLGNRNPLFALVVQSLFPVLLDGVVLSFAPVLGLPPTRLDPTLAFHAMQHRVEHAIRPGDLVAG